MFPNVHRMFPNSNLAVILLRMYHFIFFLVFGVQEVFWTSYVRLIYVLCSNGNLKNVFHWQFLFTYILSVSLKSWAWYITGQWGEFRAKNVPLCLYILFNIFCCCCFHQKISLLIIFISFLMKYQFFATEY